MTAVSTLPFPGSPTPSPCPKMYRRQKTTNRSYKTTCDDIFPFFVSYPLSTAARLSHDCPPRPRLWMTLKFRTAITTRINKSPHEKRTGYFAGKLMGNFKSLPALRRTPCVALFNKSGWIFDPQRKRVPPAAILRRALNID